MRAQKLFCCIAFSLSFFLSRGQNLAHISGKVTTSENKPLASVSLHLLNTNHTTASDSQGDFSFEKITPGKYILQVSAIGYASITREINATETSTAINDLQLKETSVQLDAVTVTAEKKEALLLQLHNSHILV